MPKTAKKKKLPSKRTINKKTLPPNFGKDKRFKQVLLNHIDRELTECDTCPLSTLATTSPVANGDMRNSDGTYTTITQDDIQKTMDMASEADLICGHIPGQMHSSAAACDANGLHSIVTEVPIRVLNAFINTGLEWFDTTISMASTRIKYQTKRSYAEISYVHENGEIDVQVTILSEPEYTYRRIFKSVKEMSAAGKTAGKLLDWFIAAVGNAYQR